MDVELERLKQAKLREILRKLREPKERFPSKPLEVDEAKVQQVIGKYRLVVVDCWAPWCGPCRMIAPLIEEMAEEYAGKIVFCKLNVDENPRFTVKYGITGIPTLLVFREGRLVDRIVGAAPRKLIEGRLKKYLEASFG